MDKGRRIVKVLLIPSLLGLAASLVLYLLLNNRQQAPVQAAPIETVGIVAAKGAIPPRVILDQSMLQIKQVPKTLVGTYELRDLQQAVGQVTTVPLVDGQVVLSSMLADKDKGLSYAVPKGKRAVTLRVDEFSGVAGYPEVGDNVDLVVTYTSQEKNAGSAARLLLQNVQILAKGAATPPSTTAKAPQAAGSQGKEVPTSYTLALTPQQAVQIALAEEISSIKFILRSATDDGTVSDSVTTDSNLFGVSVTTPAAPAASAKQP